MDEVAVALLSIVLTMQFITIREVYMLKAMFKNHLKYLHAQGGGKDA